MIGCSAPPWPYRRGFSCAAPLQAWSSSPPRSRGCALNEGPGQLAVDPGRYEFYHCGDLATRLTVLQARETELRTLMAKAGEGGSGALVGALAYRADYETVLSEEKLLQRTAAEKKCEVGPPPAFQSDQTVR